MAQWRLTALCRQEFFNLGKFERQTLLWYRIWNSVLVVDWEWLTPITLAAEYCIAETIVYLYPTQFVFCHELFGLCNSLFHCQTVKVELTITKRGNRRICHYTLFCIEALFADIAALYERTYLNAEVLCEGVVAAVVCRNSHNGTCTITREYIVAHPNRNLLSCDGVDGICAGEHTCYIAVDHTFTLGALLCAVEISLYSLFLVCCSELGNKLAFGSKYHECNTEYCVGTCGEDCKLNITIFHAELHFCTLAAANPVTLCLFE